MASKFKIVNGRQSQLNREGRLEVDGDGYVLPTASATVKGGVRVGANLSMTGEVLSADDQRYDDFEVRSDIADLESEVQNLQDQIDEFPAGESARTAVVTVPNTGWSGSVTLAVAGLTGPHVVSPVTAAGAATWAAGGWWASSPADGELTITGDIQPSADPVDVRVVWWS